MLLTIQPCKLVLGPPFHLLVQRLNPQEKNRPPGPWISQLRLCMPWRPRFFLRDGMELLGMSIYIYMAVCQNLVPL